MADLSTQKPNLDAQGIDVDEIMRSIRGETQQQIITSPSEMGEILTNRPDAEATTTAVNQKPLLHFLLREFGRDEMSPFAVSLDMQPTRVDQLPLIGQVWGRARRLLHSLAIFYTNRLGQQVREYHRQMTSILQLQLSLIEQQSLEIEALRQRLAQLEAQAVYREQKG